jgi:hypothetical protein
MESIRNKAIQPSLPCSNPLTLNLHPAIYPHVYEHKWASSIFSTGTPANTNTGAITKPFYNFPTRFQQPHASKPNSTIPNSFPQSWLQHYSQSLHLNQSVSKPRDGTTNIQAYKVTKQEAQQPKANDKPIKTLLRRTAQRRAKRYNKIQAHKKQKEIIQTQYHANQCCLRYFGFIANPNLPKQQNFRNALQTNISTLFRQPKNLTYHNLCTLAKVPPGTKQLLGLNLKYCLATNQIHCNIKKTLLKLAYSIRTEYAIKELGLQNNQDYKKQIYIKNKSWNPTPASLQIEEKLTEFEHELKSKHKNLLPKYNKINLSNLNPVQANALKQLKADANFVIKPTDKNLGPAIMDTKSYTQQVLKEHLLTSTYKQLTETEAKHKMESIKATLKLLLKDNQNLLPKSEWNYFQRSLQQHHRLPIFYGLPKIHKTPVSLRPVVSGINSLLAIFSNWVDYKLKSLLPHLKSFVKDSAKIIKDLKTLSIPGEALLFSADATSMYTNIDTGLGVKSIQQFLSDNSDKLPPNFPTDLLLQILTIIMDNNVFSFASTYWIQLSSTATGTPVACTYAMLSFGQYKQNEILTEFKPNLFYYKRYIDDILGIWIPSHNEGGKTWEQFTQKLNNWGKLKWITQNPSTRVQFLDFDIKLDNGQISMETYQKSMNLYLYIPPSLAHPPSCLKGLICGELRQYWLQNTQENFQKLLLSFIQRLQDREHKLQNLTPLFNQAAAILDNNTSSVTPNSPDGSNTLYIHWQFHPNGLQRSDIRLAYNKTLQPYLLYNNMRVAISRPKNLRDILAKTALKLPQNADINELINTAKRDQLQDV